MKDNADYGVLERRPVPARGPVQRDEIIFLYKLAREDERDRFLRRIEIWHESQQRTLVFLTNHRHFAASTGIQAFLGSVSSFCVWFGPVTTPYRESSVGACVTLFREPDAGNPPVRVRWAGTGNRTRLNRTEGTRRKPRRIPTGRLQFSTLLPWVLKN